MGDVSSLVTGLGWRSGMESPKATRRGRVRRKKGVGRGRKALRRSMVTAITAEAAQSIDFPSQGLNQSIIV